MPSSVYLPLVLAVSAVFFVAAGYIPQDKKYLGIVFLTISLAFMGFTTSGYDANYQDIAAR